jgi:putative DNA primase/helicase
MDITELDRLLRVTGTRGDERDAYCPAHDDRERSLTYAPGTMGGIVVKCHRGCEPGEIMHALNLTMADLMPKARVVAQYDYQRLDGTIVYSVQRWSPKSFRCVPKLPPPGERILYQQKAIWWARESGSPLYIVEGEKDADRLCGLQIPATCNCGGAGKWLPGYSEQLAGCHVVIVADNDMPGRRHARTVAKAIDGHALSVRLLMSPVGKDVSDLLDAGRGLDALIPLPSAEPVGSHRADTVTRTSVRWAWPEHFALGKLSLIEGDPGDGKSLLTLDLAARWSVGAPMPDGSPSGGPGAVILISAEDDASDTIVPRLSAAGADLRMIYLITHGQTPDLPFEFESGLSSVEELARDIGAIAILIDPLMAFLGDSVDSHSDHSVRRALQPLRGLAERSRSAVAAVRHLNKSAGGLKAIYRGGGSIAFTGAARTTFLVATDPDDREARLLACVKNNLARKPPTLRFTVETNAEGVPFIAWRGSAELDAQGALDGPMREPTEAAQARQQKRTQRTYEIEFLMDALADGPRTWAEIVEDGKSEGFNEHGLRNARSDIGLKKLHGSVGAREVRWTLPRTFQDHDDVAHSDMAETPFDRLPGENEGLVTVPNGSANGQTGEASTEALPAASEVAPAVADAERDAALDRMPLRCMVCYTPEGCERYYRPHWLIRCREHNPLREESE